MRVTSQFLGESDSQVLGASGRNVDPSAHPIMDSLDLAISFIISPLFVVGIALLFIEIPE